MSIRDEIKKAMALAFFASAYADQADECDQPLRGEIMDQLPNRIDDAALHAADTLEMGLISRNTAFIPDGYGPDLQRLYEKLADLQPGLTTENFGHYTAMGAMGHGVGLWDVLDRDLYEKLTTPYVEFGSHSLQKDYFQPIDEEGE